MRCLFLKMFRKLIPILSYYKSFLLIVFIFVNLFPCLSYSKVDKVIVTPESVIVPLTKTQKFKVKAIAFGPEI